MPTLQSIGSLGATSAQATFRCNGASTLVIEFAIGFDAERAFEVGSFFQLTDADDENKPLFTGIVQMPRDSADPTERHILTVRDRWSLLETETMTEMTPWGRDTRVLLAGEYQDLTKGEASTPENLAAYEIEGIEIKQRDLNSTVRDIVGSASLLSATVSLSGSMFPTFVDGVTRSQAVLQVLRWCPGALAWFDHAGQFHAVSTPSAANVSVSGCEKVDLAERDDLRVGKVEFIFRKSITSNLGSKRLTNLVTTASGSGKGNTLVVPVDLADERHSLSEAMVELRVVNPESLEWWYRSGAQGAALKAAVLEAGGVEGPLNADVQAWEKDADGTLTLNTDIRSELVSGSIPQVFRDTGSSGPFSAGAELLTSSNTQDWLLGKIKATAQFRLAEGGDLLTLNYECEGTNRTFSGRYISEDTSARDLGESKADYDEIPQEYLEAADKVHVEGSVTLLPREDGSVRNPPIGQTLTLTGWRPDLSDYEARITQVSIDLFTSRSTWSVGPSPGIEIGDLVERMKAFRDAGRSPKFISKRSGKPPSPAEGTPSPPTTQNSAGGAQPEAGSGLGFSLVPNGTSQIVVRPSEVWGFVPTGMSATEGQTFSVAATGGIYIKVINGGKVATDFAVLNAFPFPSPVPDGETHYHLGTWARKTSPSTGLLELRINQIRVGPIDKPGSGEAAGPDGPWAVTTRMKPGTEAAPTYEMRVNASSLLLEDFNPAPAPGSGVVIGGLGDWVDLAVTGARIYLEGEYKAGAEDGDPVTLEAELKSVAVATAWPTFASFATIDGEFRQQFFRRPIAEIEFEADVPKAPQQFTNTHLFLDARCFSGRGGVYPRAL